jgi:N-acetyl-D-muramate 6-phosphate phosphatase
MSIKHWPAPKAMLFDLDGTLVDSSGDLLAALAHVRGNLGMPGPAPIEAAQYISAGAVAMLRAGLPAQFHPQMDALRDQFLEFYAANICVHSYVYPGGRALIENLEARQIRWGIVTNKPYELALALINALALKPGVLVGGDTLAQKKPHAAPVLHACQQLHTSAIDAWMIGDDPRDIESGKAAGCAKTIGCSYGFLGDTPDLQSWGADAVIDGLGELLG